MGKSSSIISGTHTFGESIFVRVWPQRWTDVVKCAFSRRQDAKVLTDKTIFWSDRWVSMTVNLTESDLPLHNEKYMDFNFDHGYLRELRGPIWFRCSTSSRPPKVTAQWHQYSSLLMPTTPRHTQLFPDSMRGLGVLG